MWYLINRAGHSRTQLVSAVIFLLFLAIDGTGVSFAQEQSCPKLTVFAPQSHYPPQPQYDFLGLFEERSPWSIAASHIDVMQFSTQFFVNAPDEILAKVLKNLRIRGIKLGVAVELGQQRTPGESECGVAGVANAYKFAETIVTKLQRLGGTIGYISLLGPFDDGHYQENSRSCPADLTVVAKRVAAVVSLYVNAFPHVVIADTEPFPSTSRHAKWKEDYIEWARIFHEKTGRTINYLQMDLNWRDAELSLPDNDVSSPLAVAEQVREVSSVAKIAGVDLGVIINGKSTAKDDMQWSNQARQHIGFVRKSGVVLDQIVVQSWHKYPFKSLPETNQSTLTSVALDTFGACRSRR